MSVTPFRPATDPNDSQRRINQLNEQIGQCRNALKGAHGWGDLVLAKLGELIAERNALTGTPATAEQQAA